MHHIEKYKNRPIIIWGHPKGTHTHSWIHYRFFRAFQSMWFDVQWLDNTIENLPDKNKNYIIITENLVDTLLHENYSSSWVIFDHNISLKKYIKYGMASRNIIPFDVIRYNFAKFTDKKIGQYITERDIPIMDSDEYYFRMKNPRILWWSELLPHEIKWKPYHYNTNKDVCFVGSRWHNNFIQLESLRLYCLTHKLHYHQLGRHLIIRPPLFKKWYLSPEELNNTTYNSFITPAIQWAQIDDGYIPCRLFINMSLSALWVSNNPHVYNLFDNDEVIVDRDIWKMMDKAQQIIKDKKVDSYTHKAIEKIKNNHTYLNRIDELFSYL